MASLLLKSRSVSVGNGCECVANALSGLFPIPRIFHAAHHARAILGKIGRRKTIRSRADVSLTFRYSPASMPAIEAARSQYNSLPRRLSFPRRAPAQPQMFRQLRAYCDGFLSRPHRDPLPGCPHQSSVVKGSGVDPDRCLYLITFF